MAAALIINVLLNTFLHKQIGNLRDNSLSDKNGLFQIDMLFNKFDQTWFALLYN